MNQFSPSLTPLLMLHPYQLEFPKIPDIVYLEREHLLKGRPHPKSLSLSGERDFESGSPEREREKGLGDEGQLSLQEMLP